MVCMKGVFFTHSDRCIEIKTRKEQPLDSGFHHYKRLNPIIQHEYKCGSFVCQFENETILNLQTVFPPHPTPDRIGLGQPWAAVPRRSTEAEGGDHEAGALW